MIMSLLLKGWGILKMVPREVWYALAALAVVWFYGNQRYDAGRDECRAEYAEAAREAIEQARQADAVAGEAIQATKDEVEQKNDEARNAAAGSDDPLRAGLDRLR